MPTSVHEFIVATFSNSINFCCGISKHGRLFELSLKIYFFKQQNIIMERRTYVIHEYVGRGLCVRANYTLIGPDLIAHRFIYDKSTLQLAMTRGIFKPFARRKKAIKKAPSSAEPSVKGYDTRADCLTCYDLDFHYVPQPHKNPNICSMGQAARYWISSAKLAKNTGCKSCQFLKSAFDTLTGSWGMSVAEGSNIPYQIAIIDQNDAGEGGAAKPESNRATHEAPRSLKVIMRCDPEDTKGGKKGGFEEEFEIEIYTPMNGDTNNFLWCPYSTKAVLHVQARHRIGRPLVLLAKCRRIRVAKNVRTSPDNGSKNVIKATRIAMDETR